MSSDAPAAAGSAEPAAAIDHGVDSAAPAADVAADAPPAANVSNTSALEAEPAIEVISHSVDESKQSEDAPSSAGAAAVVTSSNDASNESKPEQEEAVGEAVPGVVIHLIDVDNAQPAQSPPSAAVHVIDVDNAQQVRSPQKSHSPPPAIQLVTIHNVPDSTVRSPGVQPVHANNTTHYLNTTANTTTTAATSKKNPFPAKYWKSTPQQVIQLTASFLDAKSLCKFSRVDSATHSLANKAVLWKPLIARSWNCHGYVMAHHVVGAKVEDGKKYYQKRYQKALTMREEHLATYKNRLGEAHLAQRSYLAHSFMDIWIIPFVVIMMTLFLIFLIVQMARGHEVSYFSLWPLLSILFVCFLSTSIFCCKKYCCASRGILPANFADDSHAAVVKLAAEEIGGGEQPISHLTFCCAMIGVAVWVIILTMRISGEIQWNWSYIFLPLYLTAFLGCCAPCFRWIDPDGDGCLSVIPECATIWALLGLPILAFVILLNIRLEDPHAFGVALMFLPLFFLDLVSFFVAVYFAKDDYDKPYCKMIAMWLLLDGPLITFKILMSLRFDRDMDGITWPLIFIPMMVTTVEVCVGAMLFCLNQMDENNGEWRHRIHVASSR
jgi:hypothetical protein